MSLGRLVLLLVASLGAAVDSQLDGRLSSIMAELDAEISAPPGVDAKGLKAGAEVQATGVAKASKTTCGDLVVKMHQLCFMKERQGCNCQNRWKLQTGRDLTQLQTGGNKVVVDADEWASYCGFGTAFDDFLNTLEYIPRVIRWMCRNDQHYSEGSSVMIKRADNPGICLTIANHWGTVEMQKCDDTNTNQKWKYLLSNQLRGGNGKCLERKSDGNIQAQDCDAKGCDQDRCDAKVSQKWVYWKTTKQFMILAENGDGKCLDNHKDDVATNGRFVHAIIPCNWVNNNQKWVIDIV